jgi:hypothetical protein
MQTNQHRGDHKKRTFTQTLKIKLLSYFGNQNSLLRICLVIGVLILGIIVGATLFANKSTELTLETIIPKEREMDIKFVQDNMIQMLREVVYEEQLEKQLFTANKDTVPQIRKNEPKSATFFRFFITCSRPLILTGPKAVPLDKWRVLDSLRDETFLITRAGDLSVIAETSATKVFPPFDTQSSVPITKLAYNMYKPNVLREDVQLQEQIGASVPNTQTRARITQQDLDKVTRGELIQNIITRGLKESSVNAQPMTLREFMEKFKNTENGNLFLPPTPIKDSFAKDFPQPPKYMDTLSYLHTSLQVSNNGHVIPLYQYSNETLIIQARGSTVYLLFDPLQLEFLFPKSVRDNGELVISQVDPFDIEQHNLPEFSKYLKAFNLRVELQENEILYVPAYWWVYEYGYMNSGVNIQFKQYFKPHSASYELVMRGLTRQNGPVIINK